jgi:phosphoglycolate phosphatase
MRFRTVLFDLDGTLVDQFRAIHRCHCHAMRTIGLPEPTYAQVKASVGRGVENAIASLAGPENVSRLLPLVLQHWRDTGLDDAELLPGAREILETLRARGVHCASLTNKRGPDARAVCAHLGLAPLLDGIFGAQDTPWLKPRHEFTDHALRALKAEASATALVGDSIHDVATAQNAGLAFVGVTTGTHAEAELRAAGATEIYPNLAAVGASLLRS